MKQATAAIDQLLSRSQPIRLRRRSVSANPSVQAADRHNVIRNRVAGSFDNVLPFGDSLKGWKKAVAGGWETNDILVWQSGLPFSVQNNTPHINTGVGNDRSNMVGNPMVSNPNNNQYFNTAAFVPQPFGTPGDAPRNPLHGPHCRHFDFSGLKHHRAAAWSLSVHLYTYKQTRCSSGPQTLSAGQAGRQLPGSHPREHSSRGSSGGGGISKQGNRLMVAHPVSLTGKLRREVDCDEMFSV